MNLIRFIAKILIFLFVVWLIFISIAGLLGISIQFPFVITEECGIPYHRLLSIRIAVFLTLAYYGALYIINKSKDNLIIIHP